MQNSILLSTSNRISNQHLDLQDLEDELALSSKHKQDEWQKQEERRQAGSRHYQKEAERHCKSSRSIIYDVKGDGARKKIAKCRLDMISGNISSYSRWLNEPKRLKEIQDLNELTSCVAAITADAEENKERRKAETEKKSEEKEAKKKKGKEEYAATKQELLPGLTALMLPYTIGAEEDFKILSNKQLVDVIKYYFGLNPIGLSTMKKDQLIAQVELQRF